MTPGNTEGQYHVERNCTIEITESIYEIRHSKNKVPYTLVETKNTVQRAYISYKLKIKIYDADIDSINHLEKVNI